MTLQAILDRDKLRAAYFDGPMGDEFTHVPTREERLAEAERFFVKCCLKRGGDPKAEGLGEHGALIGGPGKPPRIFTNLWRPLENYAKPRLAPVSWFEHEALKVCASGCKDPDHKFLDNVLGMSLSGTPKESRPTAEQFLACFGPGKDKLMGLDWHWAHEFFGNSIGDIRRVRFLEGIPFPDLVRAVHASTSVRHPLADWLNQFAQSPNLARK